MSKERSVPVQKGPVKINEPTYKWNTYPERIRDREQQIRGNKDRETMEYKTPKY